MVQSNKFQFYFIQHVLIIIGTIMLLIGILTFYNPEGQTDLRNLVYLSLIGLLLIFINILIYNKFRIVRLSRQVFIFDEGEEEKQLTWFKIKKIERVPFVTPPLYFVKLKDNNQIIIFPTESIYSYFEIQIPFMSLIWDRSEMGQIIKLVKRDFGI